MSCATFYVDCQTKAVEPTTVANPELSPVSGRAPGGGGEGGLEPSPVSGSGSAPPEVADEPGSINTALIYKMTADERASILDAKDSKDVPIKLRNKLYAALNRFLTSPKVTRSVAEAWKNAADKGHHSKFEFLQTWARDTSGGQVALEELHRKESTDTDELLYSWITKYDLYINKNAYRFPQIMVYCDKLIAAARSKKHVDPKFRNDPEMKMYRILNSCLENHTESSSRTSDMRIKADVDKGAHETVIQQFAVKAKIEMNDCDAEKSAKRVKVDVETMRSNKIKADLDAGAEIVKECAAKDNVFLKQVVDAIKENMTELKSMSHKMHEFQLMRDEAKVNEMWDSCAAVCKTMKKCIDSARSLLCPGSFSPYTTQWDTAL